MLDVKAAEAKRLCRRLTANKDFVSNEPPYNSMDGARKWSQNKTQTNMQSIARLSPCGFDSFFTTNICLVVSPSGDNIPT